MSNLLGCCLSYGYASIIVLVLVDKVSVYRIKGQSQGSNVIDNE